MHSQTFNRYKYVYMNNLCCCLGLVSNLIWFSSSPLEDVHSGCQADPVAHCYRLFGEDGIDHFRVVREPGLQTKQDRLRSVSVAWGRFHKLFCALHPNFEKLFRGVERALRSAINFNRAISMICAVRPTFMKSTHGGLVQRKA